jgi:hypothetical protein
MTTDRTTETQQLKTGQTGWRFRFVVLTLVACSAVLIVAYSISGMPHPVAIIGLAALMILATHRETFFADETALSGSFIVALAAVVKFVEDGTPLGFAVCALFAGLHFSHLRTRAWARLGVNASVHLVSASLAALSLTATLGTIERRGIGTVIAILLAVLVYWVANNFILAVVLGTLDHSPILPRALALVRSETEMLLFALAGAGCGYLMVAVDLAVGFVGLVVLLVAVDVIVIRHPRIPIQLGARARGIGSRLGVTAVAAVLVTATVLVVLEPLPPLSSLLLLLAAVATVGVLGRRLPLDQHLEATTLVALVSVAALHDSSPWAGPALVGIASGIVLSLTVDANMPRRLSVVALAIWPAIVAAAAASALPVVGDDGLIGAIAIAVVATLAAVLARSFVSTVAVALRVRTAALAVGIGDLIADAPLAFVGVLSAIAAWYSLTAGIGVALAGLGLMWLFRRRAMASTAVSEAADREALLTAVTVALCDRPGRPSRLSP